MTYQPQKIWSWGQNEGHSSQIKFWVQGKNDKFFPQPFFQFFYDFLMHFHVLCNIKKIWHIFSLFQQDVIDFHYLHGQKWKILTQIIKAKLFVYKNWTILLLWSGSIFSFLTMLIVKIDDILLEWKNDAPNFLYFAKYIKMY